MKNDEDKTMIIWRIMTNDEDKKKDSVEDHEIDDLLKKINISRHLSVWLQKCHNPIWTSPLATRSTATGFVFVDGTLFTLAKQNRKQKRKQSFRGHPIFIAQAIRTFW